MSSSGYPRLNYRFRVRIDDIDQAGFQEVTIPESSQEPVEYRCGDDKNNWVTKQPGMAKFGTVTLKSGVTDSLELYKWRKLAECGKIAEARRNVCIALLDDCGGDDVAMWNLANAWPSKYESPSLNSTGNEVAVETLELQIENIERVK